MREAFPVIAGSSLKRWLRYPATDCNALDRSRSRKLGRNSSDRSDSLGSWLRARGAHHAMVSASRRSNGTLSKVKTDRDTAQA